MYERRVPYGTLPSAAEAHRVKKEIHTPAATEAAALIEKNKKLLARQKELKRELKHKDELLQQVQEQYQALLLDNEERERRAAEAIENAAEAELRYLEQEEACREIMKQYKEEMGQLMAMLRKQKRKEEP